MDLCTRVKLNTTKTKGILGIRTQGVYKQVGPKNIHLPFHFLSLGFEKKVSPPSLYLAALILPSLRHQSFTRHVIWWLSKQETRGSMDLSMVWLEIVDQE
jgi:hypothetical protein